MSDKKLVDYAVDELSPNERQELRRLLEQERRMRWLWSTIRIWLGWISGAVVGGYAVYQAVKDAASGWFR